MNFANLNQIKRSFTKRMLTEDCFDCLLNMLVHGPRSWLPRSIVNVSRVNPLGMILETPEFH